MKIIIAINWSSTERNALNYVSNIMTVVLSLRSMAVIGGFMLWRHTMHAAILNITYQLSNEVFLGLCKTNIQLLKSRYI